MKEICIHCQRSSTDGNLWCQEVVCPIGRMHTVFSFGEPFGDLEIVKLVTILRSSAIYEAKQKNEPVLLKIAHDGHHHRLKREAEFLWSLQQNKTIHSMLPTIRPALAGTQLAYGKLAHQGKLRYYSLFEYKPGELLANYLTKKPQPYFQEVAWIGISLTEAIALLHQQQLLHLALQPESIHLRFDKQGIPRISLLDLGSLAPVNSKPNQQFQLTVPSYIAPELLDPQLQGKLTSSADVYGIGLLLYEMLEGHPAFKYHLRPDDEITKSVLRSQQLLITRDELSKLPQIAQKASQLDPQKRYQDIISLAQALLSASPTLPPEKKERKPDYQTTLFILASLMVITMILIFAFMT